MRASQLIAAALAVALTTSAFSAHAADAPPRAGEGELLAGGGFTLLQPKWEKKGAGKNTDLVAKYQWGDKGERTATVADAGTHWLLTFADTPGANELAKLTLIYQFALLPEDKRAAQAAAKKGVEAAIKLVGAAIDDANKAHPADAGAAAKDAAARVKAGSGVVVDALKPLRDLRTSDGKPGDELVLEALGFHKAADGTWELPALALEKLRTLDEHRTDVGLEPRREKAEATKVALNALSSTKENVASRTACSDAVKSALDGKGDDIDGLKKCGAMAFDYWKAEAAARIPQLTNEPAKQQALKDLNESITKLTPLLPAATAKDFKVEPNESKTELEQAAQTLIDNGEKVDKASYSIAAFKFFRQRIALHNAEAAVDADTNKIVDALNARIETMTQQQVGVALLEQGAEKRRFQVSTGVVYAAGLDQMMLPLMVSYCIFDGCIGKGKTIFSGEPLEHLVSIDLGVRGSTIERADPRDSKDVSFFTGISLDPFWFIRMSGGAYVFFNGQSHAWNTAPYFGVTADLVHAAALLGVTGLGVPQAPKQSSISKATNAGGK